LAGGLYSLCGDDTVHSRYRSPVAWGGVTVRNVFGVERNPDAASFHRSRHRELGELSYALTD